MMKLYYYVKFFGRDHRNYNRYYHFQNRNKDKKKNFQKTSVFEVELYTKKTYKTRQ